MSLRDVLQTAEFSSLSDADAQALLVAIVDLRTDSTAYKWSGLAEELLNAGIDPAILVDLEEILGSLPIGAKMFDKMLLSGGVDFSLPGIRGQIAANLGQSITADQTTVLQACLQIGIPTGPRWVKESLSAEPTVADVTAARATIAADALWSWFDVTANAVRTQMSAGTVLTQQQAADAVAALVGAA